MIPNLIRYSNVRPLGWVNHCLTVTINEVDADDLVLVSFAAPVGPILVVVLVAVHAATLVREVDAFWRLNVNEKKSATTRHSKETTHNKNQNVEAKL